MSRDQILKAAALEDELRNLLTELNSKFEFDEWAKICSSLDVIGDTFLAILSFESVEDGVFDELKYLLIYGLLEALYLQNVAIRDIALVLEIKSEIEKIENEKYKSVDQVRAKVAAHPSSGGKHWFVPRIKITKHSFEIVHYKDESLEAERQAIDLLDILAKHSDVVSCRMERLLSRAREL